MNDQKRHLLNRLPLRFDYYNAVALVRESPLVSGSRRREIAPLRFASRPLTPSPVSSHGFIPAATRQQRRGLSRLASVFRGGVHFLSDAGFVLRQGPSARGARDAAR